MEFPAARFIPTVFLGCFQYFSQKAEGWWKKDCGMPAYDWLPGRSPVTIEMFLFLKADPDLNFCKALRWASVQVSPQLLFALAVPEGSW